MKRNHILEVGKTEVGATVQAIEWAHDCPLGELGAGPNRNQVRVR